MEYKIYACLLLKPSLLDTIELDIKYFKDTKILKYFNALYKQYKYLDIELVIKHGKDKEEAIKFIKRCLDEEVSGLNIYGYYKQLREEWREQQIDIITNQFKTKQITYKEFNKQMFELNKEDFDEEELLKTTDIKEYQSAEREYTEILELDYLTKGIEYGKLSLWSGITNHGKTSLMIQFAKECLKKKKKIFYFSGEQTADEFKNFLYVGMCSKEQLDFIQDNHNSKIYDVVPKKEVKDYLDNLYKDYIYLYNNNIPENNINTMLKVMTKAFNQGVRVFFIDNFMQLDNSEKLEEQTKIVESFKRFARDKNVVVNLVSHPRKTQFMKSRLTIFDISGTQNIANKSSNICVIIRTDILPEDEKKEIGKVLAMNNYDISQCDGIVEVIKTKGNSCKMVGLTFDKERKSYQEAPRISDTQKEAIINKKEGRKRDE